VKGTPNKSRLAGISAWAREMFEDPRYELSVRARLYKGRLPPQVECKLLAYAFGEPPRDINLNASLRGIVSVVHEHVNRLELAPTRGARGSESPEKEVH
jgi:hypothetical protein